jgi:tetratricopeptide (TPR) repeat protein
LVTACAVAAIAAHEWGLAGGALPPFEGDLETVLVVSDRAPVEADGGVVAVAGKGRVFGVLDRLDDRIEIKVCVGTEVRRGVIRARHVRLLRDGDVDLSTAALRIAKAWNREMDLAAYRARLDALTERLAAAARPHTTPRERLRSIGLQLFQHEGFSYQEGTARLDIVLDQKKGNCLALSLLYLFAGRRLGLPLHLVIAPGHVFVRLDDDTDRLNIETTRQGSLHTSDVYLRGHLGYHQMRQAGGIHGRTLPDARSLGVLFNNWAAALAKAGRFDAACGKYARAVEINPECADAYSAWGGVLTTMGKHAEACRLCELALQVNPRCAEAFNNWGAALAGLGQHANACGKFAKAVDINPRLAQAYAGWGAALTRMSRYAEACARFALAIDINPRFAEVYAGWGEALAGSGRLKEACAKYAEAVELNPKCAEAYLNWGNVRARMGAYGEACAKFAKAIEINPGCAEAYCNWGGLLAHLGKRPEAIEKLNKAAQLDPRLKPRIEAIRKEFLSNE